MKINRRNFIQKSKQAGIATAGLFAFPVFNSKEETFTTVNDNINFIGPKKGYSPQIGTLVSMMNWMRDTILNPVRRLSTKELDYLHDENSNSIGAMLWHLAATERYYQLNTFEDMPWGSWSETEKSKWDIPSRLGDNGRAKIKGNNLKFYLDILAEVRNNTLTEFAKRDDEWLLKTDENWGWGPTNNYCKWFHVCEHESNHNGQIKYIKSRIHS